MKVKEKQEDRCTQSVLKHRQKTTVDATEKKDIGSKKMGMWKCSKQIEWFPSKL